MISYIPDHVNQALARLISQYQKAPTFQAWVSTYLRRIQILEDAIWDVITRRTIDGGIGVMLDNIGKILNRPRGGLSDDNYRIALRAEIAILRSNGTAPDLQTIGSLSIPAGFTFELQDLGNAALLVSIDQVVTFSALTFYLNLFRAKQGGVRLFYMFAPAANPFIFNTDVEFADSGGAPVGGTLLCVL